MELKSDFNIFIKNSSVYCVYWK